MRNLLAASLLLVPSLALAQPYDPAQPPPPAPAEPPPGPPPPAPVYAPQPAYQPAPYAYAQRDPWSYHRGLTFEANLGVGYIHASVSGDGVSGSDNSDAALGGLDLGLGGWATPRLAITARIAGVTYSEDGSRVTQAFFGPSLQYWITDQFWAGGGVGFSVLAGDNGNGDSDSINGWGLDLRAGYTFNKGTDHTFNLSVELNPGFYSESGLDLTYTGVAVLAGYQFL